MFSLFEKLVQPYPESEPALPPKRFFPFLWACTRGLRPYLVAMTLCTAVIGAFEALLFAFLGRVVDWLGATTPARLWAEQGRHLLLLGGVLGASVLLVAFQSLLKQQAMAGNFPMLLRWNFHRLMLAQSLHFYQDEFAGRISAKVMQTALAVRDAWMILAELMVFVVIYFVTIMAMLGSFDHWLLLPFASWLVAYLGALWFFVPRLGQVAKAQADARSTMTGRITDAYTNIATVKLFSHSQREAGYARSAMQEFLGTVQQQMRFVTAFEIVNHVLSMGLIAATAGTALWLWTQGHAGVGALAAATAMALRLNGISHWVMWEMASLFEHIGTVQDGINTLSRPQTVIDRPDARPLHIGQGDVRFEHVTFAYGGSRRVIENLTLHIRPGEKVGLVGRSGAGKSTIVNLLLRLYDVEGGRVLVDGQDIAHATQDSLRSQVGMVTQDTSLLHRSVRDNILYGRPDASDVQMIAAARRRRGARVHPRPDRPARTQRLRRACRRARGQAQRRAAPAHRDRPGDAEGRPHPAARRGHQRARFRGRGGDPGQPLSADGRQDRGRDRAPPVDHRGDGPAGGAGPGADRGAGRSPQLAGAGRTVCAAVGASERWVPGGGRR